jgi:hypothetical protein
MSYKLKHFSIADVTHHAEIEGLTGKVKFTFEDNARSSEGLDHYLVVDVAISVTVDDSLGSINDDLLDKATAILQSALAVMHKSDRVLPQSHNIAKPH